MLPGRLQAGNKAHNHRPLSLRDGIAIALDSNLTIHWRHTLGQKPPG
jgi:hypothetical protein